jgi:hypothetical protein
MKYITAAIIVSIFTIPLAIASGGGQSLEQIYKATNQGKPVVELIDKSTKKTEKQICITNVRKNEVKEKLC